MDPAITAVTPVMSHHSASPSAPIASLVSPPAESLELAPPTSLAGTLPRSLDGVFVSASVLDELVHMYVFH